MTTPQPVIDPTQTLEFTLDGQPHTAYLGDTIASALYRSGQRIFSRSFKYHRPRGLLCLQGACPNCLMTVDGVPNERACTTPVTPGMAVHSQNAWPSLDTDALNVADVFSDLLPVGFYYKLPFAGPLWPLYEPLLRNAAGLGKLDPDPERHQSRYYDKQYRHADLAVIGAGPAGMSAALAAAALGARVTLIDQNPTLGGHLRDQTDPLVASDVTPWTATHAHQLAAEIAAVVHTHQRIDVLTSATAFGRYDDNFIGIAQGNRLIKLRAAQLVVATGRLEQPLVFENNDLPGIFLGSAVQRLMHRYDITPGQRALVVTSNDHGWRVARDLLARGIDLAGVADARSHIPDSQARTAVKQSRRVIEYAGHTIRQALGSHHVSGATLIRLNQDDTLVPGSEITLNCDLIALSTGFVANNALLAQSGCELVYDVMLDDFRLKAGTATVQGAGHAAATGGLANILLEGHIAGMQAALKVGRATEAVRQQVETDLPTLHQRLDQQKTAYRTRLVLRPMADVPGGKKRIVCLCEDVSVKDLQQAIGEGFDDIQTLKRYSTISMGPCQGKMCALNTIRICARETGRSINATGTTTARPPYTPVRLGLLAGRKLEPVRLTPTHQGHVNAGAVWMDAGSWKRPLHYGDPAAEVAAVRQRVGIIDVSTLGKIDLRGPRALDLLERVYTGRFASLPVNRTRYGLMCTDEGIILDDGVVARLGEQRYYLTTTSGGSASVYEWLTWWQAGWRLDVHLTNVTMSWAAVNVAGPRARQLLAKLTAIDLSPAAFPYMDLRQTTLAGVPARLMRIGFVGEVGYEIHFPAAYGEHVWAALLEAGAEFGVQPFGIEAQRILRLEKKHIIVGQDTDALSDPYGAGMGWAVKLKKGDFVGQPSLARRKAKGVAEQLVGFEMADADIVPGEGDQILENGKLIGRITSARFSPTLGKSIGMAWVPLEKAHEGMPLMISTGGQFASATVVSDPFYDPTGERLRG